PAGHPLLGNHLLDCSVKNYISFSDKVIVVTQFSPGSQGMANSIVVVIFGASYVVTFQRGFGKNEAYLRCRNESGFQDITGRACRSINRRQLGNVLVSSPLSRVRVPIIGLRNSQSRGQSNV